MTEVPIPTDATDWKPIAWILGNDRITVTHIENLLVAQGIQPAIHGSRAYAVEVPLTRAAEAAKILRSDAQRRDYHISFGSDELVGAPEPKRVIQNTWISSVLKRPEYGSDTALGRFLRSEQIIRLTTNYPYVALLSVHERQYLATPTTYSTGHDVELELHDSEKKRADGSRGYGQLLNDGREIAFFVAGGWRFDKS